MKALISGITLGILVAITAGCEGGWQFGGSASQINESGNWMDISGTYIPTTANGYLVSDYSAYVGTTSASETLFTSVAGQLTYTGNIDVSNMSSADKNNISGIIDGVEAFAVSAAGVISGTGITGSINLGSGQLPGSGNFAVTLTGAPAITTNRAYYVTFTRSGGSGGPGGTGTISTFSVSQSGNAISIRDNNGSVYTGQIALTETNTIPGGSTNTFNSSANYQFDATGVSQAGYNVELVGNFLVNGALLSGTNILLNTFMSGTWLEQGGKTGHISGQRGG